MNDIIDVSRYQENVDMFEKNYWAARAQNIPVGAYYYAYAQDKVPGDKELAKLYAANVLYSIYFITHIA